MLTCPLLELGAQRQGCCPWLQHPWGECRMENLIPSSGDTWAWPQRCWWHSCGISGSGTILLGDKSCITPTWADPTLSFITACKDKCVRGCQGSCSSHHGGYTNNLRFQLKIIMVLTAFPPAFCNSRPWTSSCPQIRSTQSKGGQLAIIWKDIIFKHSEHSDRGEA